jgi:hypothetical protein
MQPEVVQIGPYVISKIAFEAFVLLTSVCIGGFITYLTTRSIENRKWAEQKKHKRQEQRREALAQALEWIPPIHVALTKAQLKVSRLHKKEITRNELIRQWPNLLSELAKRDLPMRLNVLLPITVNRRVNQILEQLQDLQSFALRANDTSKPSKDEWIATFHAFVERHSAIEENLKALKQELTSEYENTFE